MLRKFGVVGVIALGVAVFGPVAAFAGQPTTVTLTGSVSPAVTEPGATVTLAARCESSAPPPPDELTATVGLPGDPILISIADTDWATNSDAGNALDRQTTIVAPSALGVYDVIFDCVASSVSPAPVTFTLTVQPPPPTTTATTVSPTSAAGDTTAAAAEPSTLPSTGSDAPILFLAIAAAALVAIGAGAAARRRSRA